MKKYIAIFTLFVFFLAQFGRVIDFCFCTMAAYQQTRSLQCDCERELYNAVKTANAAKNQTPQHLSFAHHAEELFHLSNLSSISFCYIRLLTTWPKSSAEALFGMFEKNIFHPPLQLA